MKNDKNTNFLMKNNNKQQQQQKIPRKVRINLELHSVAWTHPTDPWCNMLQTLETWEDTNDKKLSVQHTLWVKCLKMVDIL